MLSPVTTTHFARFGYLLPASRMQSLKEIRLRPKVELRLKVARPLLKQKERHLK